MSFVSLPLPIPGRFGRSIRESCHRLAGRVVRFACPWPLVLQSRKCILRSCNSRLDYGGNTLNVIRWKAVERVMAAAEKGTPAMPKAA